MTCLDCGKPAPAKRKRCEPCRIAAEKACTDRANARQRAVREAYRAKNPFRCRSGCGAIVEAKNMICAGCKGSVKARKKYDKTKKRESEKKSKEALRSLLESNECSIVPEKPKPYKYAKITKTAEQVEKECKKEERRLEKVRESLPPLLLAARYAPSWMVQQMGGA